MKASFIPDYSIAPPLKNWACVLDPTLVLSDYGLPLVKHLGEWMELWIVRELWHILDNPQFYVQQPEAMLTSVKEYSSSNFQSAYQKESLSSSPELFLESSSELSHPIPSQRIIRVLQAWQHLRTTVDRNLWNIHFLADVMGESALPPGIDTTILWRWESLAQSLDDRLSNSPKPDSLTLAYRDLAALAAARPACILTHRTAEEVTNQNPPAICHTLEQWDIPCQPLDEGDAIAHLERHHLRQLLVSAGLSKLVWSGLNLAVLHLMVPGVATLPVAQERAEHFSLNNADEWFDCQETHVNLWEGAQGFWYAI